jgi:hypothetical protein
LIGAGLCNGGGVRGAVRKQEKRFWKDAKAEKDTKKTALKNNSV